MGRYFISQPFLFREYIENERNTIEIGNILNINSYYVWKALKYYDIPIRTKGVRVWTPKKLKQLERLYGIIATEELAERLKTSVYAIYVQASKLGFKHPNGIGGWNRGQTKQTDMRVANNGDAIKEAHGDKDWGFMKGVKPWNWNGHPALEGCYGNSWSINRRATLERDDNMCQECGVDGVPLDVHHVVPYQVSKNNDVNNLVSLCRPCHGHVETQINGGRET